MSETIIMTNPARCRDCYRCVRNCDAKAIRVKEGQAQVVPELCILCGTCVRICPQKAKTFQSSRQEILEASKQGRKLIASVAPSAPAFFDMNSFTDLEKALKGIGFYAAEETAIGAQIVAEAHRDYVEKNRDRWPVIASACPVVVNMIEKYHPDLIGHLAPIVSPMIAHGRLLSRRYGEDAYIVFIGPCIAKKMEVLDVSVSGAVNAAMTFMGLKEWLSEAGIECHPSTGSIGQISQEKARLFPIEGGLIGTAGMNTDILEGSMIMASGLEACHDAFHDIRAGMLKASLVELLACKGGCVNGPAMSDLVGGIYLARQKVIDFHARHHGGLHMERKDWPPLERGYRDKFVHMPKFSEEEIQDALHRVNKYSKDDELNCGACGYSTCREKAMATLQGMAEPTMCIPYMRSRAESLRQVVMDMNPNSIIVFDNDFIIRDMSPAAEELFKCTLLDMDGKHLSELLPDLGDYIAVRNSGKPVMSKVRLIKDGLIAEHTIVRVEGQPLMVAIIRDVTEREKEREKFRAIREETLERTREVVSKQMRVAHEIAHLLGETTAESKTIFSHLAKLLKKEGTTSETDR